jgi:hypothetical protein
MNRTFLALAVCAAVGIGGMALARHDERGGAKVTTSPGGTSSKNWTGRTSG